MGLDLRSLKRKKVLVKVLIQLKRVKLGACLRTRRIVRFYLYTDSLIRLVFWFFSATRSSALVHSDPKKEGQRNRFGSTRLPWVSPTSAACFSLKSKADLPSPYSYVEFLGVIITGV